MSTPGDGQSAVNRRAGQLVVEAYERTHPKPQGMSGFDYYLEGIRWVITTDEGREATRAAHEQARRELAPPLNKPPLHARDHYAI